MLLACETGVSLVFSRCQLVVVSELLHFDDLFANFRSWLTISYTIGWSKAHKA